jgi:hypothetical protein
MIKYSGEWEEEQEKISKEHDRYAKFLRWYKEKEKDD